MPKLENILQEEVLAEINGLLAEAEAKAGTLLREAQEQAEALKASRQRALEAERAAALKRAKSAAELQVATARMKAKGEVVDQVYAKVLEALEGLAAKPEYAEVLKKLAEEAVGALGEAEAVVVNPEDAAHLQAWAQERGLELRTDAQLRLGVRAVAKGGKSQVENTLPERLERAWETLSARVAQILWG